MGRPKHALVIDGHRAMIDFVIDAAAAVCSRPVIVGRVEPSVARGLDVIDDLRPGLGPLGAIEALLASGMASQYLVCPCDVPVISPGTLGLLLNDTTSPATVFRREAATVFDPLPARISASTLPMVSRLLDSGRRGVHEFMREAGAHEIVLPQSREWELMNINTPADFDAARRRLGQIRDVQPRPAPSQAHRPARP
jgi:molybdopterin-guanine dinucleotide biosynthesis protein A